MKRKVFFKTQEELAELSTTLCDLTKKALSELNLNYKSVYTGFQCGYTDVRDVYEYFKVYINGINSKQYVFTVVINAIEKKNFYKKLKGYLKYITKGKPLI